MKETYLGAKLAIRSDNGNLANGNQQNQRYRAQEPEDIVVAALILPQVLEQEKEFDEQHCEGNQPRQQGSVNAAQVPRLRWHRARG